MRHDYNLPMKWDSMSDEEKSQWFIEERCRRQVMRQDTHEPVKHEAKREKRKGEARSQTVTLSDFR